MGIKLFVDDKRECPPGWTPARTVTEAIRILATQDVEEISLDHDIQCRVTEGDQNGLWEGRHASEETFEAVAYYLAATGRVQDGTKKESDWPIKVRIHTSNKDGGQRIARILGMNHYQLYLYNPEHYR